MTHLGQMLAAYQQKFDLEGKMLAKDIGIGESTLSRLKNGLLPDAHGLALIVLWMTKQSGARSIGKE